MPPTYRTHPGDTLDYICWKYYIQDVSLNTAMMAVDPQVASVLSSEDLQQYSNSLGYGSDAGQGLEGGLEAVLDANPGLAEYPLQLPGGLTIQLPDLDQQTINDNSIKLWD
ncbi:MAG: tail protein X [Pseudomonadales bacterium]